MHGPSGGLASGRRRLRCESPGAEKSATVRSVAQARPLDQLTLAEWAILGLLGSGQRRGFALVKALAPRGEVGRIWSAPTPVVYRAIHSLRAAELIEMV